jgi:hypothetical protein
MKIAHARLPPTHTLTHMFPIDPFPTTNEKRKAKKRRIIHISQRRAKRHPQSFSGKNSTREKKRKKNKKCASTVAVSRKTKRKSCDGTCKKKREETDK